MAEFTQDGRSLRVESELPTDTLLLVRFEGREAVSSPFEFDLELLSERNDIAPDEVLRKPMWIELELPDGSKRHYSGICNRFSQGATDAMLTSYTATIVPWVWFLSLRRDCRIFQEMTPQDIIAKVFSDAGYSDFDDKSSSRPRREYCVQYRESDLNFVHRLMEEEGIFYLFEHTAGGHKLVMVDAISSVPTVPGSANVRMTDDPGATEDAVRRFDLQHSARIGKVTYRDYDHLQPSFTLESSLSGEAGEEAYDYAPGRYVTREGGEALAQYELEAEEALREEGIGSGNARQLVAGNRFTLAEHPNARANQEYLLLEVRHSGDGGDYRSSGATTAMDYQNSFQCIPASLPYRPRRITAKPIVRGSQTAVVVGPAGEEIYTDNHGRVKLQFHWDRVGKKDENSSCWIRVSHPWAGKGWGAVSIPRIGQEVIVDFLEGDPDQPIVVGRVYNAEQTPPFALPDNAMVSGIKSNSTPGGGGYNGIELNDTKGKEKVSMHAQYNMDTTVENDQTLTVHNNRTATVDVDETMSVGANQKLSVGGNQTIEVSGNQEEKVSGNRTDEVSGNEDRTVSGSQTFSIGGDRTVEVGGNDSITAGANMEHSAGANLDLAGGANVTINAGANAALEAAANVDIAGNAMVNVTAGAKISLSAGGSTIEIGPDGIKITAAAIVSINGMLVKIN